MTLDNKGFRLDHDSASGVDLFDDVAPTAKLCKAPEVPGALCDSARCSTRACVLIVTDLSPGQSDGSSCADVSSDTL